MKTEKEKMLAGELYSAADAELRREFVRAKILTQRFNTLAADAPRERRTELLRELLGACGNAIYVEPPFRCDYGKNIFIGENFYANYDCIIVDVCRVKIGKNVLLGPRVGIYTAEHPIDAGTRARGLEFGAPIEIGDDVWIGANAVILSGVRIGAGTVISAGSVVTRDVPAGVVAAGNPCRVLRKI